MSTPYGAVDGPEGRYYYVNAGTPQEEKFRSVTAPLSRWDKENLQIWAAALAGIGAFDELPALVAAVSIKDCGRTYIPCKTDHTWDQRCPECRCRVCEPCLIRWMRDRHMAESHRRSDEGTRVHEAVGHWTNTGRWIPVDQDIQPYIDSFKAFIAEYGLQPKDWEMLEARVLNRQYMYAGTLDAIIHFYRDRSKAAGDLLDRISSVIGCPRLNHAMVLADYKSREKPERAVFMDMPLQLAGYRYAEVLRLRNETELPMPQVDATVIIQIRPDKTAVELVLAEEPEFAAFLNLLGADGWAQERGKRAIGARTFSFSDAIKKARSADSRAAKRAGVAGAITVSLPAGDAAALPDAATDDSPAARGARAAAAARRGPSPVLVEMKAENAEQMRVMAGRGGGLSDDEIPF